MILEEYVLLLYTEPWLMGLGFFENIFRIVPEISISRFFLGEGLVRPLKCLTKNKNILASSEGVFVYLNRLK